MTIHFPLWKLAARNLLRNRRRTLATGLAITFGFIALVLLGAYILRAAYTLSATTAYLNLKGHIAIRKMGSLENFTNRPGKYIISPEDQQKITYALSQLSGKIEFTGDFLSGSALLTNGVHSAPILITGVNPQLYSRIVNHPQVRKWASDWAPPAHELDALLVDKNTISITTKLAEYLGRSTPLTTVASKDNEAQLLAKNYFRDLGVVDVNLGPSHSTGMAFLDATSAIGSLQVLQDLYSTEGIEYVAIFLQNQSDTESFAHELRNKLGSSFEVFTYNDPIWSQFYSGQMNFLYVMGGFFTILILGTVSLAVVNTTTLNLIERSREIGTLRALGFQPSTIRAIFALESILLCAFCLGAGVLLSKIIASAINSLDIRINPPGAQGSVHFLLLMSLPAVSMMGGLMILITSLSTFIITLRKSRTSVVTLLGETGA